MFEMDRLVNIFLIFSFVVSVCSERPIVQIEDGLLRGHHKKSFGGRKFMAFEGIPYAKPPIQKLRFREPESVEPWLGTLEATTADYKCLQRVGVPGKMFVLGQEDCLYLNVYAPGENVNLEQKLDVIVYIHGGAFMMGDHTMGGPEHLMDRDVVFVNFNYRLGIFGFYSAGDKVFHGNYGLKDQTAVLEWVRKNIEKFGGNKDSVTITGLSAGGASVHLHYFSTASKGLFHRGFAQSGVALNPWVVGQDPWRNAKKIATEVGCLDENVKVIYRCLKQRPALQLMDALKAVYVDILLPLTPFAPATEFYFQTAFLLAMPYLQLASKVVTDVPLLISVTTEEGVLPAANFYNRIDELNEKWNYWLPIMLEYDIYDQEKKDEVSAKIKEFYFKNESVTHENFDILVKLCTQRMFHMGAERAAKLQANATESDVYFLMMGYAGESNLSAFYGGTNFGVGHGEDSQFYYTNSFLPLKVDNEQDLKMKDILVDMLVNFAKTGKPTIEGVDFQPVPKSGNLKYLLVKGPDDKSMKSIKRLGAHEFWRSLGLREEENAFVIGNKTIEIK